ncbi:MAG: hypothetical protein ACI9G1_005002 [Pirellulaceae bacterium]
MKYLRVNLPAFVAGSLLLFSLTTHAAERPLATIFDTDIRNDVHDVLALEMIHALQSDSGSLAAIV